MARNLTKIVSFYFIFSDEVVTAAVVGMTLQGTKALEAWCRSVTQGYPGVNILNMTTSWRSGLGFCAIVHHHCPDLLDFYSLDPDDVFGNNELAFQVIFILIILFAVLWIRNDLFRIRIQL